MINNILKEFLNFLKSPDDRQFNLRNKEKLGFIAVLLILEIVFTVIIILPLNLGINEIIKIKQDRIDYSDTLLYTLVLFVIVLPFVEEVFFRYVLRYKGFKTKVMSRRIWNKIFPFLVYFLSIGFGFIHLGNYLNESKIFFFLSPFIILSQLVGGLIISFIRIRISFIWGVIYHCIWNFLFAILIPLIIYPLFNPYEEKTDQYILTISEKPFFNNNENQILKIDSSNNIKKIEIKQYSLQHVLDTLYQPDTYYVDDVLIDLNYRSTNGITKEEFLKLLRKEYDIQ